jgi:alpha-L-fucosidase 2
MNKFYLYLTILSTLLISSCNDNEIRIVCIGDSITEGAGIENQFTDSYPAVLDHLLGNGFNVLNCGQGGATMLKMSDYTYWKTNEMFNVFAFQPEIIIIALGTNDSKDHNWNGPRFEQDYLDMIKVLKADFPESEILICLPPPAFNHSWGINDSTIREGVIPIIQRIAIDKKLQMVDFYTPLKSKIEMYPDSIHPNEAGANLMAEILHKAIIKL